MREHRSTSGNNADARLGAQMPARIGGSRLLRRRVEVGRLGERAAADLLRRRGFDVVGTGFTARRGEIDLICRRGTELVVVEVKTRTFAGKGADAVNPAEAVTDRKRRSLMAATAEYRALAQWRGRIRFAVVSVLVDEDTNLTSVELIDDPFG